MNKLNDFDPEVLRVMLGAVISKSAYIKAHVERIEAYGEDMRKLMAGELIGWRKEICALETAEIQIATAIGMQETQSKIFYN